MIKIDDRYYSGDNLLSKLDKNGKKPGIFLSNSNRSAGKTTYFQIRAIEEFLETGKQVVLVMREKSELKDIETTYEFVIDNYFSECIMTSKWYVDRIVMGLYLDGKLMGFAISLKDAVKLKKYSAIFGNVKRGIMDELQPEDGKYLRDETELMTSIIKTVSRGNGEQSRYIEWCFLSNNISVMNPYFINLEIYKEIPERMNLKPGEDFYISGDGWVCEFSLNDSAAKEMRENPAINAFASKNNILGVSADFLISSNCFIEKKISGKMDYIYTLRYKGVSYGVRRIKSNGIIYITSSYDAKFKYIIALSESDHDDSTVQMRRNTFDLQLLRDAYATAKMRFSDLKVKDAILEILGIDLYR